MASSSKSSKTVSAKTAAASPPVASPKLPCRVTVTEPGWQGAKSAAIAAGCSSVSDMLEKLGSGELAIITSDAIGLDPMASPQPSSAKGSAAISPPLPQHIHIHTPAQASSASHSSVSRSNETDETDLSLSDISLFRLAITGICAAVIIAALLYIADRVMTITTDVLTGKENVEDIETPVTGDIVAGYTVSDEYGLRPVHPVTGERNVPHNGVDLATPVGTPIHAVGKAGDTTTVKCWWDKNGGGWVVNQTAESYPDYVFQSLHMSKENCKEGKSKAGEVIAYSGDSGLGTGAHYDFRVKIEGKYVPPDTKYLESAMTGKPPRK